MAVKTARPRLSGQPNSVARDGDDVAQAAGEHAEMPRAVREAHTGAAREERDADGIREAAGNQPPEARPSDRPQERIGRDNGEPSKHEIRRGRHEVIAPTNLHL